MTTPAVTDLPRKMQRAILLAYLPIDMSGMVSFPQARPRELLQSPTIAALTMLDLMRELTPDEYAADPRVNAARQNYGTRRYVLTEKGREARAELVAAGLYA